MKNALLWGLLGLLLGLGVYPLISVYIFQMPVKPNTSGCIGMVLGVILFSIKLTINKNKETSADDKKDAQK